ncbi:MAG: SEC-C domain-containing protein [Candidatus Sungiibacteriota bacterium]|uniref:SEC-C domain-containing protein n=1 Tax=Candidatus Sungiibacteriota bacterium TaxID=2750080 RepID=A0A7T5UPJ2_9BACT|nr:MAG: SEC-C domain-containing protein [Candidatus Sungbacteria bacterium]
MRWVAHHHRNYSIAYLQNLSSPCGSGKKYKRCHGSWGVGIKKEPYKRLKMGKVTSSTTRDETQR